MATITKFDIQINKQVLEIIPSTCKPNNVLFSFKEYDDVLLMVDQLGDKVTLPTYTEECRIIEKASMVNINVGEYGKHLLPGLYSIHIGCNVFYYKVLPQHQTEESYNQMVYSLEQMFKSELYSDNKLKCNSDKCLTSDNNRYDILTSLLDRCLRKLSMLDPFSKTKLMKLHTHNTSRSYSKLGTHQSKLYLSKVTSENNELLRYLILLKNFIEKQLNNLRSQIVLSQSYLSDLNQKQESLQAKVNISKVDIDENWRKTIYGSLVGVTEDTKKITQRYENLIRCQYALANQVSIIKEYINKLYEVGCSLPKRHFICKAQRYLSLFKDIQGIIEEQKEIKNNFELKDTSTLFEYFGILKIFNSIHQLFPTVPPMQEAMRQLLQEGFTSLHLGDITLSFTYDRDCPQEFENSYTGIVNLNSRHSRPDLVIYKYEENILKDILIVEMKYRRADFLYNKNYHTSTFSTILDYKQLAFVQQGVLQCGVVHKVLLLYPLEDKQITISSAIHRQICSFIGINMDTNLPEELIKEINDFIG